MSYTSYTVDGLIWKDDIMEKIEDEIEKRDVFFRQDRKLVPGLRRALEIIRQEAWAVVPEPERRLPPPKKPAKPPECAHKFKDYGWYLIYRANDKGIFSYKMVEPYLCLKCKQRKDVCLEEGERFFKDIDEYKQILEDFRKKYPQLKDRAEIEDEINDDMMVDREYLRVVEILNGKADVDRSIKLVLNQSGKEKANDGE